MIQAVSLLFGYNYGELGFCFLVVLLAPSIGADAKDANGGECPCSKLKARKQKPLDDAMSLVWQVPMRLCWLQDPN